MNFAIRRLLVMGSVFACLVGNVQARLGETEQECEARYGQPTPQVPATPGSDRTLTYTKDDITVTAEFVKGRCLRIAYTRAYGKQCPQEQLDVFFKANAGGSGWVKYQGAGRCDFVRADGARALVTSRYDWSAPEGVTFTYPQWQKLHDKAVKAADAAKKAAEEAAKKEQAEKFQKDF